MTRSQTLSIIDPSLKPQTPLQFSKFCLKYLSSPYQQFSINNCEIRLYGSLQRALPSTIANYCMNIKNQNDVREETLSVMKHLVGDGLIVICNGLHETALVPAFSELQIFSYTHHETLYLFDTYKGFCDFTKSKKIQYEIDKKFLSQCIASDRIHSKRTIYEGLHELKHGSSLTKFESQYTQCFEFNHLPALIAAIAPIKTTLKDAKSSIRELVFESIKAKAGNGIVGMSVSGGFDSSLLACLFGTLSPKHTVQFYHLYSSKLHNVNEIEYFNDVRSRVTHEVKWLDIENSRDYQLSFPHMRPGFRPPPVSGWYERNWMLYDEVISDGIETLLCGDGGDQLMLVLDDMSLLKEFYAEGQSLFHSNINEALLRETSIWNVFYNFVRGKKDQETKLWSRNDYDNILPILPLLKDHSPINDHVMPDVDCYDNLSVSRLYQLTTLNDARHNTIGSSLGVCERKPFLYWPLIQFCLSCPRNIMFTGGRERGLFRNAFTDEMPRSIANRTGKSGDTNVTKLFGYEAVRQKILSSELISDFLNFDKLKEIDTNNLNEETADLLMRTATVDAFMQTI